MSTGPTSLPLHDRTRARSFGLVPRLLVLAAALAAEMLLLSIWLDNDALIARGGIAALIGHWAAWAVRGAVGFAALFATFAWLKDRAALLAISSAAQTSRTSYS